MDKDYLKLVEDGIDCWSTREGSPSLSNEDIRRYKVIQEKLVDDFPKSPEEMNVSRDKLKNSIRSLIKDISTEPDPLQEFEQRYGSIIGGFMSSKTPTYEIGFPLNLKYAPDKLEYKDYIIERMDRRNWEPKFKSKASGNDDFEDFIEESTNSLDQNLIFWKVEIEANNIKFAVEKLHSILEVILGELIYCLQHWTQETTRTKFRIEPYTWSELRHPFIYIVLRNGNYERTYYDKESHERVNQSAPWAKQKIKSNYKQIPTFKDTSEVDQNIIGSFRNYYRGTTESVNNQAFFNLWRAIENLALTGRDDNSRTVLDRAVSVIDTDDLRQEFGIASENFTIENRIHMLKEKRNGLVHHGNDIEITDSDLELLRAIYYNFLPFLLINRKWERENIIFWLENVGKDKSALDSSIKSRENNISHHKEKANILRRIYSSK